MKLYKSSYGKVARDNEMKKIILRAKVRQDYLNGITSYADLGARHGLKHSAVALLLKNVLEEMREESRKLAEHDLELAERRIMNVYSQANESFQKSLKDAEEVTTMVKPERCSACRGSGIMNEALCDECQGEGYIEVESVTQRKRGQAGDSNFLRVQLDCIKELNRIKGYSKPDKTGPSHLHIHQAPAINLSSVPDELLLKALETVDQMKALPAIDVNSMPIEPTGE